LERWRGRKGIERREGGEGVGSDGKERKDKRREGGLDLEFLVTSLHALTTGCRR